MTESKERFTVREAIAFYEIVRDFAALSATDPDFTAKALEVHERASRMVLDRHERRKIANKKGQAISAAVRKEKKEQRNAVMREAILTA